MIELNSFPKILAFKMKTPIYFSNMVASTRDFQRDASTDPYSSAPWIPVQHRHRRSPRSPPKFTKVSSFQTPFSSNDTKSRARKVFVGVAPPQSSTTPFPKDSPHKPFFPWKL